MSIAEPSRDDVGTTLGPEVGQASAGYFGSPPRPIERALFVAAFALLTFFRFPSASLNGRFWAEEGSVFYVNAWTLPVWRALLRSDTDYLNLAANAATLLAYRVPIEAAPHVTSGVALLVHCCPALLLAFAKDSWLQGRGVLIAALLMIAVPPGTEEVWLNSLNSQNVLALSAGIVLALDVRDRGYGALQKILLALAALSSPASWCLVPLFFLRAALDRSWPRAVQGLILLAGTILQVFFFYHSGERQLGIDPVVLNAAVLMKHVLLPLLGHHQSARLAGGVAAFAASPQGWLLLLVIPLGLAAGALTLRRPRGASPWFFLAAVAIAALSYYAAQNDRIHLVSVAGSARYVYAPQALIGLAVLSFAVTHRGIMATVAQILVAWLLLVGVLDYFRPSAPTYASGPSWSAEVRAWKQDPAHELKIWPRGWTMRLPFPLDAPPSSVTTGP